MAKGTDRIDRTIEFWRTRRIRKFLLTQKTIELLRTSIEALDSRLFTLQHIQALNLAVALFEAQLRDCLRLAVDNSGSELDTKSEFLDIKIDAAFINQMRSRRFTLGEFVFINTGISTIERLWGAMSFCFPDDLYGHADAFRHWCEEKGRSPYELAELKASLAWVYTERNRYVHEFFDETALALGESDNLTVVAVHLGHAYDFLMFVQSLKEERFSYEYPEDHPSWGKTGKAINQTNKRIEELRVKITDLLPLYTKDDEEDYKDLYGGTYIESIRSSLTRLISASEDYTDARVDFAMLAYGPSGTARNDIAAHTRLAALEGLESTLTAGLEDMRSYVYGPRDDAETPPEGAAP
jgi:hypothetical protein